MQDLEYNDVVYHINSSRVNMGGCSFCGNPNDDCEFHFIEKLYVFEKMIRFNGRVNYYACNKPNEEYPFNHTYCLVPVKDSFEDKLLYGVFYTKEEAEDTYFKRYDKKHRDYYRKCLRKENKTIKTERKAGRLIYYSSIDLNNRYIPEENKNARYI